MTEIEKVTYEQTIKRQDERIKELENILRDEVSQLRKWARESRSGGWSTHQVDPMNKRADEICRVLIP
jgi:hypothetical protein